MSKGFAPTFALMLAAATLTAVLPNDSFAQRGELAKDGTRKVACGCYVCGTPLTVLFGEPDCAGILAEDACGGSLGGLPPEMRAGFCQKLTAQFGSASLNGACRAYAQYCGPETTAAQSPGGTSSPGQPGKSPGGQGPAAPKGPPPTPGKAGPDATKGKEVPMVAGSPGQTMVGGVRDKSPVPGAAQSAAPASTAQAASSSGATPAIPLPLGSLRVDPSVTGGNRAQGWVELSRAPGPNGLTVTLESGNTQLAQVPSSITIGYGTTSAETGPAFKATFPIDTKPVNQDKTIFIKARVGAQTLQAGLHIRAPKIVNASLDPPKVCDGIEKGTVKYTLNGPAPPGLTVRAFFSVAMYPAGSPVSHHDETRTLPAGDSAGSFRMTVPRCGGPSGSNCYLSGSLQVPNQFPDNPMGGQMGGSCKSPQLQ